MKFTPLTTLKKLLGPGALFGALIAVPLAVSAASGPMNGSTTEMGAFHQFHMREMMQMENWHMMHGIVQSVSTSTGSFVMNSDDEMVTVHTNASTTFAMGGTAPGLSSLSAGSLVHVAGTMDTQDMHLVAHMVMTGNSHGAKMHMNHGMFHGQKNGWMNH
jgi:hypothetical protein